jgi:hypothetical protein
LAREREREREGGRWREREREREMGTCASPFEDEGHIYALLVGSLVGQD